MKKAVCVLNFRQRRETLQALEIKIILDAGERDLAAGHVYSHKQVGKMLQVTSKQRKRKS